MFVESRTRKCFPHLNAFMSIITIQWIKPKDVHVESNMTLRSQAGLISWNIIYSTLSAIKECYLFFVTTVLSFLAVAINLFPLVMYIVGWATCSYDYSSICYTLYFNYNETISENELPQLALRNIEPGETIIPINHYPSSVYLYRE